VKILKHEKSGKLFSIQADPIQDTRFYWKSITIQLKKQIFYKIINCSNFFGKFKLHLKEHDESTRSKKMAVA